MSLLVIFASAAVCRGQGEPGEYTVDSTSHTYSIARLKTTCVDIPALTSCKVEEFGRLGQLGDTVYYYAVYRGTPSRDPSNYYRGVRIFEGVGNGDSAALLFEWGGPVYDIYVDKPELVRNRYGIFLHVFMTSGNGSWEMGDYYIYRNGRWVQLQYPDFLSESNWDKVVDRIIPEGYWLCRGNEIDLAKMLITLPVYKGNDACCCPTGGSVTVYYKLRADSLVIDSASYSRIERKYSGQ